MYYTIHVPREVGTCSFKEPLMAMIRRPEIRYGGGEQRAAGAARCLPFLEGDCLLASYCFLRMRGAGEQEPLQRPLQLPWTCMMRVERHGHKWAGAAGRRGRSGAERSGAEGRGRRGEWSGVQWSEVVRCSHCGAGASAKVLVLAHRQAQAGKLMELSFPPFALYSGISRQQ